MLYNVHLHYGHHMYVADSHNSGLGHYFIMLPLQKVQLGWAWAPLRMRIMEPSGALQTQREL